MALLVFDTFTGTNGTDIDAHTPDVDVVGGGWIQNIPNEVELDGSGAVKFSASGDSAWIDAGTNDQICTGSFNAGGADNRFAFAVRSDNERGATGTNYTFNIQAGKASGSDNITIFKRVSGALTALASKEMTLNGSTTYELECSVIGSDLTFKVDGVEELSVTDTSIATGDYAGFYHALYTDSALRIYDFQVDDTTGITITESLVNSNYTSLDPTITLTGTISITESLVNTNYTALDPNINLVGTISVTESLVNANYDSLDPTITFTGTVSITENLVNTNYTSLDPTVTLTSTAIQITESTVNVQYQSKDPSILLTPEPIGIVSTVCFDGVLVDLVYNGQEISLEYNGQSVSLVFSGQFNELEFNGTIQTTCNTGSINTDC